MRRSRSVVPTRMPTAIKIPRVLKIVTDFNYVSLVFLLSHDSLGNQIHCNAGINIRATLYTSLNISVNFLACMPFKYNITQTYLEM